jgi:hypothetical protein
MVKNYEPLKTTAVNKQIIQIFIFPDITVTVKRFLFLRQEGIITWCSGIL